MFLFSQNCIDFHIRSDHFLSSGIFWYIRYNSFYLSIGIEFIFFWMINWGPNWSDRFQDNKFSLESLLVVFLALAEIIGWSCFDRLSFDLFRDEDLCLRDLGRPNRGPWSLSSRLTVVSVLLPNLVLGCAEFIAFDFAWGACSPCHSWCNNSGAKNCSRSP